MAINVTRTLQAQLLRLDNRAETECTSPASSALHCIVTVQQIVWGCLSLSARLQNSSRAKKNCSSANCKRQLVWLQSMHLACMLILLRCMEAHPAAAPLHAPLSDISGTADSPSLRLGLRNAACAQLVHQKWTGWGWERHFADASNACCRDGDGRALSRVLPQAFKSTSYQGPERLLRCSILDCLLGTMRGGREGMGSLKSGGQPHVELFPMQLEDFSMGLVL